MARRRVLLCMFLASFWRVYASGFELGLKYEACKKCDCRVSGLELFVRCRGLNLLEIPKGLPPNTTSLDLSNNGITTLQFGNLSNLTYLRNLYLQNNKLTTVPPGILNNLKYLKTLNVTNNSLDKLPLLPPSLVYVNLDFNDISTITEDSFTSLLNLQYLNICCNRISTIESKSFPESLINLDLHDNVLKSVPTKALKTLGRLQHLDLDVNPITCIHNKAFDGLHNLSNLSINWERVSQVEHHAFYGLPQLRNLSLVNVSLKRFPNLTGSTSLKVLILSSNNITSLPPDFCEKFPKLQKLNADTNKITRLPDMSKCTSLEEIKLEHNHIATIDLQGMTNLKEISLKDNKITNISKNAFKGNSNITALDLRRNCLSQVPTKALKNLGKLQKLDLSANPIKEIHEHAFEGLTSLSQISLSWEKVEKVDEGAFRNLPSLKKLSLVDLRLKRFPDLTGTHALQVLELESNAISSLPKDFCEMFPTLSEFNANMNRITSLPDMSKCASMVVLQLTFNRITSIGTSLQGMQRLTDITLKHNAITEIPRNAFKGLTKLDSLNIAYNKITTIPGDAFVPLESLTKLIIAHNKITNIAEDAFIPLKSLTELDLSYNDFPKLPSKGMNRVRKLKLRGNKRLKEILADSLPNVRSVEASYPYHCCEFRKKLQEVPLTPVDKKTEVLGTGWTWAYLSVGSPGNDTVQHDDDDLSGYGSAPLDPVFAQDSEGSGYESTAEPLTNIPYGSDNNFGESYDSGHREVNCTPLPDPFFPCEDLMGSWLLRVGVWLVFMLALLGNAVVIIVIILSKNKLDVSKFLIINLAVADLCMGVYLGCLAIVDASTIGNFRRHGVEWQQSLGCKTAGFLAVLSSESSVFTLAVITIERYIAIRHALHIDRKMSLRKTAIVMASGWFMAFIIATLPLVKVSDYTKFSICLPFETGDVQSVAFVTLLLSFNFIAFVVIFGCYVRIYFEIRGSNAWNTSDTQVAMRMALLVVTDFLCWAPIVIIALPAAFGSTFVSLEQAKVFTVFIFPLNSCANPFLYAIFTYQFKKDCLNICRRVQNSPVPPMIQFTLTKKRLSMSGIPVELRNGSRASDVICTPETQSDGRMTLRVPSLKFNRRYSLPAAFKLTALSQRSSGRNSAASIENENSKCSNENSTEQTIIGQDKPKQSCPKKASSSENLNSKQLNENVTVEHNVAKERPVLIDRRTAV